MSREYHVNSNMSDPHGVENEKMSSGILYVI